MDTHPLQLDESQHHTRKATYFWGILGVLGFVLLGVLAALAIRDIQDRNDVEVTPTPTKASTEYKSYTLKGVFGETSLETVILIPFKFNDGGFADGQKSLVFNLTGGELRIDLAAESEFISIQGDGTPISNTNFFTPTAFRFKEYATNRYVYAHGFKEGAASLCENTIQQCSNRLIKVKSDIFLKFTCETTDLNVLTKCDELFRNVRFEE